MKYSIEDGCWFGKTHSKYDGSSINSGRDLIYWNRLQLAKKMGLLEKKVGSRMYSYLQDARLGIILH